MARVIFMAKFFCTSSKTTNFPFALPIILVQWRFQVLVSSYVSVSSLSTESLLLVSVP